MFSYQKLSVVLIGLSSQYLIFVLPALHLNPLTALLPVKNLIALADITKGYVPPPRRDRRVQRTEGGGSRGCSEDRGRSLTLLTPNDHIPTTVSGRPTFLWYVRTNALQMMRFTVVEPNVSKPIMEKFLEVEKPGIVQIKISPNIPELVEGKKYRWTVSIVCNERRRSENIYARAWIERVPNTPALVQKMSTVTEERERAMIYANSGIWYDAISTIYQNSITNSKDQLTYKYLFELLDQVGLSKVAAQERQRLTIGVKLKEE